MTIAGISRQFATNNQNWKQDMHNGQVQAGDKEGKKQRSCEEIQEEYTRELETTYRLETEGFGTMYCSRYIKSFPFLCF